MSFYDLPFFSTGATGDTGAQGPQGPAGPQGPQGEQGEPGTAGINATITEATATIDSTSGTPKVNVSLGGTSSARTFAFAFTGLKGTKGDKGDQGEPGIQGETGSQGTPGANGKSAYELYKEAYPDYSGTLEEWLESLKGTNGETGPAYVLTEEDKAEIVAAVLEALATQG